MKLQCGSLGGLQRALAGTVEVGDIASLVQAAQRGGGGLEGLPFPEIVQSVAAWRLRRRAGPS